LIPLSAAASRGDQILNAHSFEKQGFAAVLEEEQLNGESLEEALTSLWENRDAYVDAMAASKVGNPIETIIGLLEELAAN
jgi:UDP-N-acetylglucosamine--N-acetylmuramyl-(pentapeptide) pyrophosphoryl-undecaprenol N-acetylglucosamine transferase